MRGEGKVTGFGVKGIGILVQYTCNRKEVTQELCRGKRNDCMDQRGIPLGP
jgi:hypothetical protein